MRAAVTTYAAAATYVALCDELARLEAAEDVTFEFSDDHSVWCRGRDAQRRMAAVRGQIAAMTPARVPTVAVAAQQIGLFA